MDRGKKKAKTRDRGDLKKHMPHIHQEIYRILGTLGFCKA